jgi:hypothetical protein
MSTLASGVSPRWLRLREPADAAARSLELVRRLRQRLPTSSQLVIHDLGGGSGAMGRWLAPRLPGPQHWVVHDRDPDLLELAVADPPGAAADGSAVTVEARHTQLSRIGASELAGADLVVASALLDLLTAEELGAIVEAWAALGPRPMLLALTVTGRVALAPADPLDPLLAAAFNEHQRRSTPAGRLLGPDAAETALGLLRSSGAEVVARPSPWRLAGAQAELAAEWLSGWVAAACERQPALAEAAYPYRERRLAQASAGRLAVTVGHADLLVLP